MGKRIYIAEDEENIRKILQAFLVKEGFRVETFENGLDLLEAYRKTPADLVILDIMMPELDGMTVCGELRRLGPVPVIFVSAKDSEADRIRGIVEGADDYLTKPFSPLELVARVQGLFRRVALDRVGMDSRLRISGTEIDPEARTVMVAGVPVPLTGMEFSLLCYLAENRNRAVSRKELLDKVWGFEATVETRATDDMVKRIRKKLQTAGSRILLETVWGYGFRIREEGAP